jgi:excisionase family DNA binding protein
MSKAAFSIEEFCSSYSVGKTTAYEEINAGRLRAVKVGRRTLIPEQSAAQWLQSQLPVSAPANRAALKENPAARSLARISRARRA